MRRQQLDIITTLETRPTIDPAEEIERRSQFLADYLGHTGLNGCVWGISGGQDSLLAGILAQRAAQIRHSLFIRHKQRYFTHGDCSSNN